METLTVSSVDVQETSAGCSELDRIENGAPVAQARARLSEGLERLSGGEPRAAAVCFEQALAAAPDLADAHIGLGIAYAVDSRVYPALDHLQRAVELEPRNFYA